MMKKIISILLLLTIVLSSGACQRNDISPENVPDPSDSAPTRDSAAESGISATQPLYEEHRNETDTPEETGVPDDFSFSLVYGVRGDMTYDSETGVLVKQRVATHVEDYTTSYFFTAAQRNRLYDLIVAMDPASYPDEYNPIDEMTKTAPSYEIVLTVTYNGATKTITCHDIAIGAEPKDKQGEKFLAVLDAITEIIYASEEWQALPDYEFLYE